MDWLDNTNGEDKYHVAMITTDGQHHIKWDIIEILKDIDNMNFETEYRNAHHLSEQGGGRCSDSEYAMKTDIEKPCIIVKLNADIEILIDGYHRLYKALKLNIESIPCYVLPAEYHKKFIVDYDSTVYDKIAAEYHAK